MTTAAPAIPKQLLELLQRPEGERLQARMGASRPRSRRSWRVIDTAIYRTEQLAGRSATNPASRAGHSKN